MPDEPQQSTVWLATYIFSFGMGAILIATLTPARVRHLIVFAVLLALCAFALLNSGEEIRPIITDNPWTEIALYIGMAIGTVFLGRGLFSDYLKGAGKFLGNLVQPRLWTTPPAAFTTTDIAKRWFVTVAAATGSLAFTLTTTTQFIDEIAHHVSLNRLVMTTLIAVGSLVLIGPVEEFIFSGLRPKETGHHTASEPSHFERLLQNMSWRAVGRILLVIFLILALNIAHDCIEKQLEHPDSWTTLTIVMATVPPAVVTWFWCGALQSGAPNLAEAATGGSVAAGMLLYLPASFAAVMQSALVTGGGGSSGGGLSLIFTALIFATLLGAAAVGVPALGGGLILAAERRKAASTPILTITLMVLLLCVLMVAIQAIVLWVFNMQGMLREDVDFSAILVPGVASNIGWGVGLLVSGFPEIVRRAPVPGPMSELTRA